MLKGFSTQYVHAKFNIIGYKIDIISIASKNISISYYKYNILQNCVAPKKMIMKRGEKHIQALILRCFSVTHCI